MMKLIPTVDDQEIHKDKEHSHLPALSFPIATIYLVTVIMVYNIALFNGKGNLGVSDKFFSNKYDQTLEKKEIWRPFTSWIPHVDWTHLLWDTIYLLAAGIIFEMVHGKAKFILIFMLGTFAGSWLCVCFDTRYNTVLGSSAGTHAVVAYFCVREIFDRSISKLMKAAWIFILCYLIYLTAHGLIWGEMGWPFVFFKNSGYDHLGGISVAIILAIIDSFYCRNKPLRGDYPSAEHAGEVVL